MLFDGILHHVKNLHPFSGMRVLFSITSKSSEESEQLSMPGLVSPDDASDTSVSEATDDDVDGSHDDGLGYALAEEEATAPQL